MVEIFDNIRKIYKFSAPCDELANYIDFFSESCKDSTLRLIPAEKFIVKMFQSWTPTFWFNLGTPYRIESNNRSHFIKQEDDVLILRNTTVTRHVSSGDHIFSIKFFPGGLEAILGIGQAKLLDKILPLKSIVPRAIIENIKKANSYEERVNLLQRYFLINVIKQHKRDYYIKFVRDTMDAYQEENLLFNTSEVAEKMFITSKTINRYFNTVVGVSPKRYFSIIRARTALTQYVADAQQFDPGHFGYYDMSHFCKEVFNFTGQKLGKLAH
ncbi:MAG: AraC family transcriptional regulator [Chitinophagaceae bacterium]